MSMAMWITRNLYSRIAFCRVIGDDVNDANPPSIYLPGTMKAEKRLTLGLECESAHRCPVTAEQTGRRISVLPVHQHAPSPQLRHTPTNLSRFSTGEVSALENTRMAKEWIARRI
ncbi:hypothetical protein CEXT_201911 [Caerostris extrusa]|uniref:Uncharacterized protein n=1 Tax=Caerostris extrusa TaxID=172846 RepID=A0AAV4T3R3_CAEEX|nr:hypothetical protein CEXT_201911 [Caerostris extrusa]